MNENRSARVLRQAVLGAAAAGVLLTATACGGGKDVTFTNAGNTGPGSTAAAGDGGSGGSSGSSGSSGGTQQNGAQPLRTPDNIEITRQTGSICVRDKTTGSQACVSDTGTAVVNGLVFVNGKLVSTSGNAGNGTSVSVNGGGAVAVAGGGNAVAAAGGVNAVAGGQTSATTGQVTLSGAVRWSGTARGTCQRSGDVRNVQATFGDGGRIQINAVGTTVLQVQLTSGGNAYSGNWVGQPGLVTLGSKSLKISNAQAGRGDSSVQLTASFDC